MTTKEESLKKAYEKESKSVFGYFIRNYRITYLIILAIFLFGLYSLFILPREADPEIKIPFAVVTTIYPGSTPTDTEELVTNKIEEKIKNIENLKRYLSTSGQGFSSIFVEFFAEADLKESIQKLKDAVQQAEPSLPREVEDPVVFEVRISDMPIVVYSLVYDAKLDELKDYAEIVREELEGIRQVSKVPIIGGLEREFQVLVDQTKLANFSLSLTQIISAIQRTNFNLPAGDIEIDNLKYNVRVKGKFESIEELEDVVVFNFNGVPIYLRDVGTILDTFKKQTTGSTIGFKDQAPRNTISLQVFKKTGGNIVNIVETADKTIEKLQKSGKLPKSLRIEKTNDNSWFIKDTLNQLGMSGLQTMILIIILLFIVLGLRGSLITGLSVPLAFLMAFIILNIQGETLNSIVLFSLVISLGLMVDNSIIIMEGINEYRTKYNKTPLEASILSVWNFKWAIISGTMTTVAAFLPMLLVSGILGQFFSFIPKTISATLLSSLFVALIIIPTLSARFGKIKNSGEKKYKKSSHYIEGMQKKYSSMMNKILYSKKRRRWIMAVAWLGFILAVAVPAAGFMRIEMFSALDLDMFIVNVKLPAGSSLEATKAVVTKTEQVISEIPELKNYVTSLGSSISFDSMTGGNSGNHLANITVNLTKSKERDRKSFKIAEELRPKVMAVKGGKVTLEEASAGPATGAPIEVRLFSDDMEQLIAFSTEIKKTLNNIQGTVNVRDNVEESTFDFTFKIDKQKASYFGLDIISVASTLRSALHGTKASTVSLNGDDVDITVKYKEEDFADIDDLKNLLITTRTGENIPLKEIAVLSLEPSLLDIRHRDGKKTVAVSTNIKEGANLQNIVSQFLEELPETPQGVTMEIGGEVEDIQRSFRETFLSMILAVILIAFILVLQFNSFIQPFIILFSLPLAVIGVILGLNIFRMPFSFPAFLGIVSLAGIAVNDAIVLIDRVNKNMKDGMEKIPALVEAGSARMQPIFLTSLTTIFGVLPLVFASELWRGFSVTLIFGLISSTVLTLVMIPILFNALSKSKETKKPDIYLAG